MAGVTSSESAERFDSLGAGGFSRRGARIRTLGWGYEKMLDADPVIAIGSAGVARRLGLIALALIAISLSTDLMLHALAPEDRANATLLLRIDKWFNIDRERNIPSYFSMLIILLCSGLLGIIAIFKRRSGNRFALHWTVLSAIFFLMSFDEIAEIHERLILPVRQAVDATDYLYFAWVIPGFAFVVLVFFAYLRFLIHLPYRFRWLFAGSGAVYVTGVLGVELVEGHLEMLSHTGFSTVPEILIYSLQETLEMAGIVLFIYALLEYLRWLVPDVQIRFDD